MKYTVTLPDHIVEGEPIVTCSLPDGGRLVFNRAKGQTSRDRDFDEAVVSQLRADGFQVEKAKKKPAPKPDAPDAA